VTTRRPYTLRVNQELLKILIGESANNRRGIILYFHFFQPHIFFWFVENRFFLFRFRVESKVFFSYKVKSTFFLHQLCNALIICTPAVNQ
jgi:hypothetical protein